MIFIREPSSRLGINALGLISLESIFGTGCIFLLDLNFIRAFYLACIEIRPSFPKECP